MFVIRRVWAVEPREARMAASLAFAIAAKYEQAGQRPDVRVYFNGTTLPGQRDRLYMEWTAPSIESTFRPDRVAPDGIAELSAGLREFTTETWVEFSELMTADKALPIAD